MTQAIAHTYSIVHDYRRQITLALFGSCMVLALIYAVNLYRVVSHSVALQQINKQQATLTGEIQTLDAQYLAVSNKLTPDAIHSYGFTQGKVSAFISRAASQDRVAMAGHEF